MHAQLPTFNLQIQGVINSTIVTFSERYEFRRKFFENLKIQTPQAMRLTMTTYVKIWPQFICFDIVKNLMF